MAQVSNKPSVELVPPPQFTSSLHKIVKLKVPHRDMAWNVFAYALNRDMINEDGSLDDLHGFVFPLGCFQSRDEAEDHARKVIEETGHPAVIVSRYGMGCPLTVKPQKETIIDVPVDIKGKLTKLEKEQHQREKELYEKRSQREKEIAEEAENEVDPDHIEHFKRQCYLALKARAAFHQHKKEMDEYIQTYEKRSQAVRDHYQRHPEHEPLWLPYLKEKLSSRDELDLYKALEAGYAEVREELLGLTSN